MNEIKKTIKTISAKCNSTNEYSHTSLLKDGSFDIVLLLKYLIATSLLLHLPLCTTPNVPPPSYKDNEYAS